jgi:large subunit ribosomal protein L18
MSGKRNKIERRHMRKLRIRSKLSGSAQRPRLSVFRSARHIYAQVVDDATGRTLAAASSKLPAGERAALQGKVEGKGKVALCTAVGRMLAEKSLAQGIKKVCFDRSGYRYHGRVKALAEGARAGGLEF